MLIGWLALLLASATVAPRVFDTLASGGIDIEGTESHRVQAALEDMGLTSATLSVVFHSPGLRVDDPRFLAEVEQALEPVRWLPQVDRIDVPTGPAPSAFVSPSGHAVLALLWVEGSFAEAKDLVPEVRAALGQTESVMAYVAGSAALFYDLDKAAEADLQRGEIVTLPIVLVLLLLVFGAVFAAALPLAMGVTAVTVTLALVYLIATQMTMSVFTVNIATFLGLGVAVDYSLLMVSRFREELEDSSVAEALETTMATAGKAVTFSAFTTGLGLAGLLAFDVTMLRSIGIGGMLVVAISLVAALTLTPAALSVIGPRIDALSVFPWRTPAVRGFWRALATGVMRRPLLVAVPTAGLLLAAGTPFLHVELGAPTASILPAKWESRQGWDIISEEFGPGYPAPLAVVFQASGPILQPENLRRIKEFTTAFALDERVAGVESIVDLDPRLSLEDYILMYAVPDAVPSPAARQALDALGGGNATLARVTGRAEPLSLESKALVRHVRETEPREGDVTAVTGGLTAGVMDSVSVLYGLFPWAILSVLAVIYLALAALFRSVILPLKAVLMNAMSIFAGYGALVFIFQDGHFEGLLGFESTGQIEATIPILLFFMLFGLSMDYEIFLLTRMKEAYDRTGDNDSAVVEGLERTGRIITSAAAVIVLVALGFATGDIVIIKALSLGIAIAVALDVSIVRTLLVPALMKLLGDWNWWAPRFMRARTPG